MIIPLVTYSPVCFLATPKPKPHPAVPYAEVQSVLSLVRAYSRGWWATRLAFEFLVLTTVRSLEVRGALWTEMDFQRALWIVPAERMKARKEHRVPLSARALEVLGEARDLGQGHSLVFPSKTGRVISDATLSVMLLRLGVDGVPHGFRSSFRDWAAERKVPWDLAEGCLAHRVGDATAKSYFRSDVLDLRREVMDAWAEYLTPEPVPLLTPRPVSSVTATVPKTSPSSERQ